MSRSILKIALASIVLVALTIGLAACGTSNDEEPGKTVPLTDATLVLDYIPNGVHAGIYEAKAEGYYRDRGINLKIIAPSSTAHTFRLILAGKADFGVVDGIDLARQIDAGRPVKAIMAILQRPAGGPITPVGKKAGGSGVPAYTSLVAFSTRDRIKEDPQLMQGFVDATVRGYQDAINDPEKAVASLISQTQGGKERLAVKTFKAYEPLMGSATGFGDFNENSLRNLSSYLLGNGSIGAPIPPDRFATRRFTSG